MKTSNWSAFLFFLVSPLVWAMDVLFGKEQFRVKISNDTFGNRATWREARQEASLRNTAVYWRRRRWWKRKHS